MSAREIIVEVTGRLDMPLPEPQTLYRQSSSMNYDAIEADWQRDRAA